MTEAKWEKDMAKVKAASIIVIYGYLMCTIVLGRDDRQSSSTCN